VTDQDTTATSAWFFKPKNGVTAGDMAACELLDFTIDGQSRPIRRTTVVG
jgi:hypothetical protein